MQPIIKSQDIKAKLKQSIEEEKNAVDSRFKIAGELFDSVTAKQKKLKKVQ